MKSHLAIGGFFNFYVFIKKCNMSELDEDNLKLMYVSKIGYNHKKEGIYEFIFSTDTSITSDDIEMWSWDLVPACENALPPDENHISIVLPLKTSTFDLFCLHEAVDRSYMHGYHTIHALAYEIERQNEEDGYSQYKKIVEDSDDEPLLVFHYGMTLTTIKDILYSKKIILKNNEFIETASVSF